MVLVMAMPSHDNLLFVDSISSSMEYRKLEDSNGDEYDLIDYSIRFGKCQLISMYDDDLAQDEDSDTVLALKNFVIYRLCPTDENDDCSQNYGEYVAKIDDYLQAMAQYTTETFEATCDECADECNDDGAGCDSDSCGYECWKYENLENNGYLDAAKLIECQQIEYYNNGDDANDLNLYIGPRCSSDGTRIVIGLFRDEYCSKPYSKSSVQDVTGYQISYHLLKVAYSSDEQDFISCNGYNNDDQDDAANVNELCENIYDASGKCESIHGISTGFIQNNRDENDYENQIENEFLVCNFIYALFWNSYTENGVIDLDSLNVDPRGVSGAEKFLLTVLPLMIVGTLSYAYFLKQKISEMQRNGLELQYYHRRHYDEKCNGIV